MTHPGPGRVRPTRTRRPIQLSWLLLPVLLAPAPWDPPGFGAAAFASPARESDCRLPDDPRLRDFPLPALPADVRCLLGDLVVDHTTSGTFGPTRTQLPVSLYEFLLDRPVVTAELVRRMGLGAYHFTELGPGRFWVEDGDGTEGRVSLVSRAPGLRLYHIEGLHRGHVFRRVPARAAVFLRLEPLPEPRPGVRTFLVAFTRLDDRLLAGLVWLLRPLFEGAITRKLTRGFAATAQLGELITRDPQRILQELPTLPFADEVEARRFAAMVSGLAGPAAGPAR